MWFELKDCFVDDKLEVHTSFSFTTTVDIDYLTLLGIMSSHSGDEDSQAEEDHPKRKSRFIESLESRSRKRKKCT